MLLTITVLDPPWPIDDLRLLVPGVLGAKVVESLVDDLEVAVGTALLGLGHELHARRGHQCLNR